MPDGGSQLGLCLRCNYPLDHLAENRCPECGAGFDPGDRLTRNMTGRPVGRLVRTFLAPPLWPVNLFAAAQAVWWIWEVRHPVPPDPAVAAVLRKAAWIVAGLWLLPLLLTAAARLRRPPPALPRRPLARWLVAPGIAAAAWILYAADAPFRLVFLWNRAAMERWAGEMRNRPPQLAYPSREIGGFSAVRIHSTLREVGFLADTGGSEVWGFVHGPDIRPTARTGEGDSWHNGEIRTPVAGDWFVVRVLPHAVSERSLLKRTELLENLAADPAAAADAVPQLIDALTRPLAGYSDFDDRLSGFRPEFTGNQRTVLALNDRILSDGILPAPIRPEVRALLSVGRPAVTALRRALAAGDVRLRTAACAVLCRMGPDAAEAVPELAEAGDSPLLRELAAATLGRIGGPARSAVPVLLARLRDRDNWVRFNAAVALRMLRPPAADVLTGLDAAITYAFRPGPLDRVFLGCRSDRPDRHGSLLMWTAPPAAFELQLLIGDYGPEAAPLVPALAEAMWYGAEGRDWRLDEALVRIGPAAVAALARLLREAPSPHVRESSATALGKIGTDPALDGLVGALRDRAGGDRVRHRILAELRSSDRRCVPALTRALADPDLRDSAAALLAEIEAIGRSRKPKPGGP